MSIDIAPVNDVPTAQQQDLEVNEDQALVLTLMGQDQDSQTLTYTIVTEPQHGILSGTGQQRTYTPSPNYNGMDTFDFTVSDGVTESSAGLMT